MGEMSFIYIFATYCVGGLILSLGLGVVGARFRCLAAPIIASASLGFFPAAYIWMQYHGPHSVLSVTLLALITAIPFAMCGAGAALLGYFLIGRVFKKTANPNYPNRRLNIILILVASLIIPGYIGLDFIPPMQTSRAGYYDMLITRQVEKTRYDFFADEYELDVGDRVLYLHIRNGDDRGEFIWLDIYDVMNAGNIRGREVVPVFEFPRIENRALPDVRGAFLQGDTLYYNFGRDTVVAKSAFNRYLSQRYIKRDFQFAKLDLTTMENTIITKAEYEQMYAQAKRQIG